LGLEKPARGSVDTTIREEFYILASIEISIHKYPMHKLTALAAGITLCLTACHSGHHTPTWEQVKATPRVGHREQDPSGIYAERLHQTLKGAGVEHKVVKFRFRYPSTYDPFRAGEDTAVLYHDPGTPAHPWWAMAEYLWNPVWLPAGSVESQIRFFMRRPATIESVKSFSATSAKRSDARARKLPHEKRTSTPPAKPAAQPPGKPSPEPESKVHRKGGKKAGSAPKKKSGKKAAAKTPKKTGPASRARDAKASGSKGGKKVRAVLAHPSGSGEPRVTVF
jgi:hypothetical protein